MILNISELLAVESCCFDASVEVRLLQSCIVNTFFWYY